jgi:hypothetical protein
VSCESGVEIHEQVIVSAEKYNRVITITKLNFTIDMFRFLINNRQKMI